VEDGLDGEHCCRELDIQTKLVCPATLSNLAMVEQKFTREKTIFSLLNFAIFPQAD